MPKRVKTNITSANTTPPRHRILETLDEHKDKMPDQAYKAIAESIAANGSVGSGVYKITYIETHQISMIEDESYSELPCTEYSTAKMKEVEMSLPNFLFSICDLSPDMANVHTKNYEINQWSFPHVYHVEQVEEITMPAGEKISVRKDVTLLSACKM